MSVAGGRSRRELLELGAAAGASLLAAGTIPLPLGAASALAQTETDDDPSSILEAAIGLEQGAVLAYTAAADSGKLDAENERAASLFARQDQEHADALTAALEDLGGVAPRKPSGSFDVPGLSEALSSGQAAFVRFVIELETATIRGYYEATAKLTDPRLLSLGASIMANEAQHLVVLRQVLGRAPSPRAFVTGRS